MRKKIAIFLAAALAASVLAGCGSGNAASSAASTAESTVESTAESVAEEAESTAESVAEEVESTAESVAEEVESTAESTASEVGSETAGAATIDPETANNRKVDNPSSEYQTYASESEYTIGVTLQNLDLESITTMKKMLEEDAELNYPNVKLNILDAQNDQSTQLQQVENFLAQGVDAVIIQPIDQDAAVSCIEACNADGVPAFTMLQKVSDMSLVTGHSGMNHTDSAVKSLDVGMDLIGGKGEIAEIMGPIGITAQQLRHQGLVDIMAEYGDACHLAFSETANWQRDEAMALTENWLATGQQIDLFFAHCDNMAMGIVQACEEAGVRPYIVSIDGDKDAIQAIIDGRLDATVAINYADMCYHSLDNVVAYLDGQPYNNEYYCQLVQITPDNAEEMMNTYFGN